MIIFNKPCSRRNRRRLHFIVAVLIILLSPAICQAHQAPYTNIFLDVNTKKVAVELQIPVPELALSFGQEILKDPATIVQQYGERLQSYLQSHIHAYVDKNSPWNIELVD